MPNVTLINPNIVVQRHDMFITGIIYMPISLAYFAAALRKAGMDVSVIDAFGEAPNESRIQGGWMLRGLSAQKVAARLPPSPPAMVLYAGQVANHRSLIELIGELKRARPGIPIVVMENTQAVTAYSLRQVQDE